jgi:uncharacterized protein
LDPANDKYTGTGYGTSEKLISLRFPWECMSHEDPRRRDIPDERKKGNHLVHEKSPYLLQHAQNPVDWYPWGEEAFSRAVREDRPVFLSVGYATCHWCHVMAHESFEDPEVAELLNKGFVCIKVDREERPDIDSVYMGVCQLMTGQGGWPLTIVMTPDKKPFFAATYIPKESRFSMTGLLTLLPRITSAWHIQRQDLLRSTDKILDALQPAAGAISSDEPGSGTLDEAYEDLLLQFDPEYGGFGNAPKFPTPHTLLFLMRYGNRTGKKRALAMVEKTLDEMQNGGICDQLGGGFHRYSTDAKWRVPHFEMMLYDQALLLMAYTEAFQITRNERYRKTAEGIIGYVLRDLTSPDGAFHSAEDADSLGGEGAFYVWTTGEIKEVLGDEDAAFATLAYGVTESGNFQSPELGPGKNLLYRTQSGSEIAGTLSIPDQDFKARLESIRARLFSMRQQRARPSCDDKVLTDWNGLFIAALAQASRVFESPQYLAAAERAMQFIFSHMLNAEGRLSHRFRDGEAGIDGFADDYTFIIHALIELYETGFDEKYLSAACSLNEYLVLHFQDETDGGFFTVADSSEPLILKKKETYDGALPSCNSVSFSNLLRLGRLTGNPGYTEKAAALSRFFQRAVTGSPSAHSWFLCGLFYATGPSQEVVIVGEPESQDTMTLVSATRAYYLPSVMVLLRPAGERGSIISQLAPFTTDYAMKDGKATAYLCTSHSCSSPVTDSQEIRKLLENAALGK